MCNSRQVTALLITKLGKKREIELNKRKRHTCLNITENRPRWKTITDKICLSLPILMQLRNFMKLAFKLY